MMKRFRSVKLLYGFIMCVFLIVTAVPIESYAAQLIDETQGTNPTVYTVTGNVSKLTFSGAAEAQAGQEYVATIANNGGCQPPSTVSVSVNGVALTPGSSTYTYDVRSGKIEIKAEAVTGNIVISATAREHKWGSNMVVAVGPSCTSQGSQGYYCEICGTLSGSTGVAATGHKFVNYVSNQDATCAKDGTKTATCSNPGCSATSTITDKGSRLSHTVTGKRVNVKVATCTEEGYTGDLLCECGAVVRRGEKTEITEHSEIIRGKQKPTCIIDGYTGDSVCRYCDEVLATGTVIEKFESHSYGDWTTVLEATDVKIGRKERVCPLCGIKESQLILPTNSVSAYVLPICIFIGITLAGIGVGFAIYFAIKKLKAQPEFVNINASEETSEELAAAIIVTQASDAKEI